MTMKRCVGGLLVFVVACTPLDGAVLRRAALHTRAHTVDKLSNASSIDRANWVDYNSFRFIPSKNVAICACAKCGSSSMYQFVYKAIFGHAYSNSSVWVHQISSSSWEGTFKLIDKLAMEQAMANGAFAFALIRDPKDRLISAWKSKVACNNAWGTDRKDRRRIVPELMALAGLPKQECATFDEFMHALAQVHRAGRANQLNRHFLPQQYGCFLKLPRAKWSQVIEIKAPHSAAALAAHLGSAEVDFPHFHATHEHTDPGQELHLVISPQTSNLLDEVTKDEYAALGIRTH